MAYRSAYVPTQSLEYHALGYTYLSEPTLLLSVNGVVYANGFTVPYSTGYRNFFPTYTPGSPAEIGIYCITLAYGQDIPEYTISNMEVYLIG